MKRLGLIVNPIAGIGGRVGLKGSDGPEIVARARALGAVPEAPARAIMALEQLASARGQVDILVYGGVMGEDAARACGWEPQIVGRGSGDPTTADDTRAAAVALADAKVDLLLFAGGDGTARDVHAAIDGRIPVLGIPAGVKIHSAAFAITPRAAGQLAALFLDGRVTTTRDAEVMDIDEEAFRAGRVSAALYGILRVPADAARTQSMKAGRTESEPGAQEQISYRLVDAMVPGTISIIGPGTTTYALKQHLGVAGTLLGVDVVRDRGLVAGDVTEDQLLAILAAEPDVPAQILVTIIGGQGYILGRGNQQISPRVIRAVGKDRIRVMATRAKISTLGGRPLLVDTGDVAMDAALEGYIRVVVGYNDEVVMRVASSPR
jgi:predicted polyphosphate/ATP-dependent NAD kinase